MTGSDGSFEIPALTGLAPGSWEVEASLGSSRKIRRTIEVPPGTGEMEIELDLPAPEAFVCGKVLGVSGEPFAGATTGDPAGAAALIKDLKDGKDIKDSGRP